MAEATEDVNLNTGQPGQDPTAAPAIQQGDPVPADVDKAEQQINVDVDPHSDVAQERVSQGLTRTGKNKIDESAKGVGGDHTIAPGGAVGQGSGRVDPAGFVHETVFDPHAQTHLGSFKLNKPPLAEQSGSGPLASSLGGQQNQPGVGVSGQDLSKGAAEDSGEQGEDGELVPDNI
jgi:hypothetical protein